ncbi:MAG: hypothetical protein JXJ19_09430 [Elusimicrobia bacterium]|nr:hypothetical protein [Elusimicrobiota bacterium]
MLKKYLLTLVVLITSTGVCFSGKVGKTGWSVFRKARSAKFKPITVTPVMAVRGDLSGAFYNPAVLAMNIRKEIFFLSELGITDDMFGGVVYGHPLKDSAIAGGIIYYDAGEIELNWLDRDGDLQSEEVSAQKDVLGLVSYGRKVRDNICLGGTVKFATSKLVERESANAYAFDVGALYLPKKYENLSLTGSLQNLGMSTKFVDKANPLPVSAFVGAGYWYDLSNDYYLTPGFDFTYLVAEERVVPELGFELGRDPMSINFGYQFTSEGAWHLGFTLLKNDYDIAYAYLPGLRLESTHRISVGVRFGK